MTGSDSRRSSTFKFTIRLSERVITFVKVTMTMSPLRTAMFRSRLSRAKSIYRREVLEGARRPTNYTFIAWKSFLNSRNAR
jgi:hypothetical protein